MFQQGAMPKLATLFLDFPMQETREINGAFDLGLGNLPLLQDLKVWLRPRGASEEGGSRGCSLARY